MKKYLEIEDNDFFTPEQLVRMIKFWENLADPALVDLLMQRQKESIESNPIFKILKQMEKPVTDVLTQQMNDEYYRNLLNKQSQDQEILRRLRLLLRAVDKMKVVDSKGFLILAVPNWGIVTEKAYAVPPTLRLGFHDPFPTVDEAFRCIKKLDPTAMFLVDVNGRPVLDASYQCVAEGNESYYYLIDQR